MSISTDASDPARSTAGRNVRRLENISRGVVARWFAHTNRPTAVTRRRFTNESGQPTADFGRRSPTCALAYDRHEQSLTFAVSGSPPVPSTRTISRSPRSARSARCPRAEPPTRGRRWLAASTSAGSQWPAQPGCSQTTRPRRSWSWRDSDTAVRFAHGDVTAQRARPRERAHAHRLGVAVSTPGYDAALWFSL
jgi:hypothetical protein